MIDVDYTQHLPILIMNVVLCLLTMLLCVLYIWKSTHADEAFKDKRGSKFLRLAWIGMKGLFFFCMVVMLWISIENILGYSLDVRLRLLVLTMLISCILAGVATSYARLTWDLTVFKRKIHTDIKQMEFLLSEVERIQAPCLYRHSRTLACERCGRIVLELDSSEGGNYPDCIEGKEE